MIPNVIIFKLIPTAVTHIFKASAQKLLKSKQSMENYLAKIDF